MRAKLIHAVTGGRRSGTPGTGRGSSRAAPYCEAMSETSQPTRRQFEYLTAPLIVHSTKAILDNFGEDGWELVQVVPGPNPEQLVAYFKREK